MQCFIASNYFIVNTFDPYLMIRLLLRVITIRFSHTLIRDFYFLFFLVISQSVSVGVYCYSSLFLCLLIWIWIHLPWVFSKENDVVLFLRVYFLRFVFILVHCVPLSWTLWYCGQRMKKQWLYFIFFSFSHSSEVFELWGVVMKYQRSYQWWGSCTEE